MWNIVMRDVSIVLFINEAHGDVFSFEFLNQATTRLVFEPRGMCLP